MLRDLSTDALRSRRAKLSALLVLLAFVAVLLVRCAWMSDDAFITFRTVQNFCRGAGLRWNTDERVQSYTHPLWMFVGVISYALAGELYYSTIAISIAMTLSAVAIVASAAESAAWTALAVVMLAGSRAIVDYAASGLENPLLFLLVAALAAVTARPPSLRRVFTLAMLTSLLATTRPDAIVLSLPVLVHAVATSAARGRALAAIALGLFPLAAWESFSLVYYGFFVPNTAYAKLNTHIPRAEELGQGLLHLRDSLGRDPLTLAVVTTGVTIALVRGTGADRALALGALAHVVSVVGVGGDFMSGRFLGASAFVGVALFVRLVPLRSDRFAFGVALGIALGTLSLHDSHWRSGVDYGSNVAPFAYEKTHGIADERAYYYPDTGLLPVLANRHALAARGFPIPPFRSAFLGLKARSEGKKVAVTGEAGFFAYFAGPNVHVLDRFALTDPLLARIPFEPTGKWRIGHFARPIPEGYEGALAENGVLKDARLAAFDDALKLITRGPLFTAARWRAIVGMNLGRYPLPGPGIARESH